MPKTNNILLPHLSFGQSRQNIDLDLPQMQERVNSITNWVSEFDILDRSVPFQHRTAVFSCKQVRVITVSSTPTVMKVNDPDCTLAIPLFGNLEAWVGKKHFLYRPDAAQALFHPPGKRHTEGGIKSVLLVSISPRRLLESARAMLGDPDFSKLDIHNPRVIETAPHGIDLLKVIQQVCSLADQ